MSASATCASTIRLVVDHRDPLLRIERLVDRATGARTTRLVFAREDAPPR